MSDLQNFSKEELQEELERREKTVLSKPIPFINPDFRQVHKLCIGYVNQVASGEDDEDLTHYIFEAAVTAVYGEKVWDYINKATE